MRRAASKIIFRFLRLLELITDLTMLAIRKIKAKMPNRAVIPSSTIGMNVGSVKVRLSNWLRRVKSGVYINQRMPKMAVNTNMAIKRRSGGFGFGYLRLLATTSSGSNSAWNG